MIGVNVKSSGDFLKELRREIENTQARRASYIKAKIVFSVSMVSVGSITIISAKTVILLYLVPFVSYIFDLYVFGEDYGIRRAGVYLEQCKDSPRTEVIWERAVSNNRDPFSKVAGISSSALVLIIAAFLLLNNANDSTYWFWLFANITVLVLVWVYRKHIDRKIESFRKELIKQDNIDRAF
jgi:preprotein translocase subunit SecY